MWSFISISVLTSILDLSRRCPVKLELNWRRSCLVVFFFSSPLFSLHGSYERTAEALQHGTGATDVRADRTLRRERALDGDAGSCSRQGRAPGLQADSRDHEAGGGEPGSARCGEDRASVGAAGDERSGGGEGFTLPENRKRGEDCR